MKWMKKMSNELLHNSLTEKVHSVGSLLKAGHFVLHKKRIQKLQYSLNPCFTCIIEKDVQVGLVTCLRIVHGWKVQFKSMADCSMQCLFGCAILEWVTPTSPNLEANYVNSEEASNNCCIPYCYWKRSNFEFCCPSTVRPLKEGSGKGRYGSCAESGTRNWTDQPTKAAINVLFHPQDTRIHQWERPSTLCNMVQKLLQ